MQKIYGTLLVAALTFVPAVVHAQGIIGGAEEGAATGSEYAGPVGGVVGGAVGSATGAVGGLFGVPPAQQVQPRAMRTHRSVGRYQTMAPVYDPNGRYLFTIVNGHTALVDPMTRQIVHIED